MKSVVLCGSGRFKAELHTFAEELRAMGVMVYEPYLYRVAGTDEWEKITETQRQFIALGLTHDHFHKIRQADTVFIFNKDGYMGNSTTMELGYAMALAKPIYALASDKDELFRQVCFRSILPTAQALRDMLAL